jgi:hypothetical protein
VEYAMPNKRVLGVVYALIAVVALGAAIAYSKSRKSESLVPGDGSAPQGAMV